MDVPACHSKSLHVQRRRLVKLQELTLLQEQSLWLGASLVRSVTDDKREKRLVSAKVCAKIISSVRYLSTTVVHMYS